MILVSLACFTSGCEYEEIKRIKAVNLEFDRACAARDAQKAVGMLSGKSFEYYDRMVHMARTLKAEELPSLSWAERYVVLGIRHEMEPTELKKADGRAYLMLSISRGYWASDEIVHPDEYLTKFVVKKDYASARYIDTNNKPSQYSRYFFLENGEWKMDFSRGMEIMSKWIEESARQERISPEKAVIEQIESDTGRPVPPSIVNPPKL